MHADSSSTSAKSTASEGSALSSAANKALWLLLGINLFNYIDRQVLSAVLPKLELDSDLFDPSDPWLKTKLGSLTTAFLLTYMLLSPVFGWLGDRRSRWFLVGVGVILWSLASGGSGLATGFWMLLLTRCLVGVGEAAYGPVAPSMLSDMYPVDHRGRILSRFYMAIPVGSALGFVIGGQVADTEWGWRGAFYVVVIPGVLLGLLCFLMKEPPREKKLDTQNVSYFAVLKQMSRTKSMVCCTAGMTCTTFVLGGVASWAPYYIFEREARFQISEKSIVQLEELKTTKGEPVIPPEVITQLRPQIQDKELNSTEFKALLRETLGGQIAGQYQARFYEKLVSENSTKLGTIDFRFGLIVVVSGLVATLLGGMLGDWMRKKGYRGAYFLVSGWSAVLSFPFFVGMLLVPFPYAWIFVFATVFGLFFNTGPANTILANVSHPSVRATAFAINILIIHLLGDAISPPLIGLIADLSNLQVGMGFVSAFILIGGAIWVWGAQYLDADTDAASKT